MRLTTLSFLAAVAVNPLSDCNGCDSTPPDADGDGLADNIDPCKHDPLNPDADNDGICDPDDLCFGTDETGDTDGDGYCDDYDANPTLCEIEFVSEYGTVFNVTQDFHNATAARPYTFITRDPGTLTFCGGTFFGRVESIGNDEVTITTTAPGETTLVGNGTAPTIDLSDGIFDVKGIQVGGGTNGIAISCGTATLDNVVAAGNDAGNDPWGGAGVLVNGRCTTRETSVTMVDSATLYNSASVGGGVAVWDAHFDAYNCDFSDNDASYGGGVYVGPASFGNTDISNSTFMGNTAIQGAGAFARGALLKVDDTDFLRNLATAGGGGACITQSGTFYATDCNFDRNVGGNGTGGGAIEFTNTANSLDVTTSVFQGNTPTDVQGENQSHWVSGGSFTCKNGSCQ